jgi:hypothetical protein
MPWAAPHRQSLKSKKETLVKSVLGCTPGGRKKPHEYCKKETLSAIQTSAEN